MRLLFLLVLFLQVTICVAQHAPEWFEFKPTAIKTGNPIDMSHWLDKPAGKHGFLQMKEGDFEFEDGTPVKFWGVNIASDRPFLDNTGATEWVKFMAGYGINGVRFHKFTWDATDGIHSTRITDANWKNFDFFCKELRDAGIYYSWSHIYGHRLMPADSASVLAYSEVANTKFPWSHLNGSTASIVNFAEDLQDINIELTVNMLNHINPITQLKYADDPALSFIELQNEDNIYWGAIEETLKQTPTYRALLCRKFSRWLVAKYKNQEGLLKAWNNQGLPKEETLEKENIYPRPNQGYFSYESEMAAKEGRNVPMHVADRAAFLYEEQLNFYTRFIKAIRKTGYKGVIVGSCWQAGSGLSHLYNLHTDYVAGPIDRHNYSGGGGGHTYKPGKFDNDAMVSRPGSGLLGTGFQQVADRPFQISEWMALIPNQWTAESSPIIAAYGMGLQGWDASFAFAMDYAKFTPTVNSPGIYNVTSPTQLSLYPALAAMVYRKDIKEGETIFNRNFNIDDLRSGKVTVVEKVSQQFDIKSFQSAIPEMSLAIGKVTLSFDNQGAEKNSGWMQYLDTLKKIVRSNTGQLNWDYSGRGFFTINSPATKGIVGFPAKKAYKLDEVTLQTNNPFAIILATNIDTGNDFSTSKRILITVMARAQNTGTKWNADSTRLTNIGTAPVLLEPVQLSMEINRKVKSDPLVFVLDHSGNRTHIQVPTKNGKIVLDGNKYKSIYYEIVYP